MRFINIRSETFAKPIIIDGIGRAGKFFLGKILCGLENIEYFQYISVLEHIPYLNKLGFINEDAAISLLQINADEHAYNMLVGRNINLRVDDGSSVTNSLESEVYIKRGNNPVDNDSIRDKKQDNVRLSPFITHETFPNIKIFFRAFSQIKIVFLRRNPIDIVHSWLLRGWGNRFEKNDLLAFIPLVKNNELQFPWYVSGWEEEYYSISEVERIIKCIDTIMSMEETAFKALSADQQENVLVIRYENLVEQTNNEIYRMEQFLNRKSSNRMPDIMLRENCPSEISLEKRMEKMNDISTKASKKYIELLLLRSEAYEATSNLL